MQQVLVVLISHNCVAPLSGETPEHDNLYRINVDTVLHRLRYPRFLLHTKQHMGAVHECLLMELLEHGRARDAQCFEAAESKLPKKPKRNVLESAFQELVEGRFVERVPAGYQGVVDDDEGDVDMDGDGIDSSDRNKKTSSTSRSDLFHKNADDLWRVNSNEFNRRFRHVACAALVKEKVDESAGHLLITMLELSRVHEQSVNEERSTPVSEMEILNQIIKNPHEFGFDVEHAKVTLEKMANDTSELISVIDDDGHDVEHDVGDVGHDTIGVGQKTYCVNMRRIIDLIRMKEIEAVVRERFGGPACRIFRLLIMKRNLEQKQIAEMAMIPVKDTRELLYKLLKAEYVQIQEVARTSDHAPSRTFYLWRVDLLRVVEQVGRELYRATSNLRARLIHELSSEKETLMLLERAQDKTTVPLTSGQRANLVRMRQIATTLESSVQRLDELICFFAVW